MAYQYVLYEKLNKVARITLNNPEKRNALSPEMQRDLDAALMDAEQDADIRCLILTGAGPAFCAGAFLGGGEGERDRSLEGWRHRLQSNIDRQLRIRDLEKPVIAAINGYCLGRGFELALSCHIVLASDQARFGMVEIRQGSMVTSVIPYLVGMKRAMELILTGDMIDAQEAERVNLVNRVVPHERLQEEAYHLARKIAKVPPFAIRFNKMAIDACFDFMGLRSYFDYGHKLEVMCHYMVPEAENENGINLSRVLREQGVKAFLAARDGPFQRED